MLLLTRPDLRLRYDYKRMDINGAREELRLIKWDEVMNGTANDNWESFKEILFSIQCKYVPVVMLTSMILIFYSSVRNSTDNATKERLMKAAWIPNETFKFPTEPKRRL